MKTICKSYVIIIIAVLLIPFVLMPAAKSGWSTETTALAKAPELTDENGNVNLQFLSDAGSYFEDHFAFRPRLITANSEVQEKVFHVSSTDQVIMGKNGWLYFTGTLDDYQRTDPMSERALENAAHNLALIKEYYDVLGIDLIVTIAPNKNSLYPENMPYYILPGEGVSNAEAIKPYLEKYGIRYADLFSAFEQEEEDLYYAQDTHWNTRGAALAFDEIMKQSGKEGREDYSALAFTTEYTHSGDLAEMLYPEAVKKEEDAVFQKDWAWRYLEPAEDNMEEFIQTENPEKTGSLYVYRDSFGSALLPYLAEEYGTAEFSRLTPYKIADPVLYGTDTVLIEKAERGLFAFAEEAPIMQAPVRDVSAAGSAETITTCKAETDGGFTVIKGAVDPEFFDMDSKVYVEITTEDGETAVYEAFTLSAKKEGSGTWDSLYQLCVLTTEKNSSWKSLKVLAGDPDELICVKEMSIQ